MYVDQDEIHRSIAEALADFLESMNSEYFLRIFGTDLADDEYDFDLGYVAFLEYGDLERMSFGSVVRQWWQVSQGSAKLIRSPGYGWATEGDPAFRIPHFRVLIEDEPFGLSESYGGRFLCYRRGHLADLKDGIRVSELPIIEKFSRDA